MSDTGRLTHILTLCGQCSCGCPELFIDPDASPERRVVIIDDFGQRVQMSLDQLQVLIDQARLDGFAELLSPASAH